MLVEGALDAAGIDRTALVDARGAAAVLLDTAGAVGRRRPRRRARRRRRRDRSRSKRVTVRVDAGDPLDDVVLRSYAIGAAHMALGWVLTEGLAVDPGTGEVLDLTIRSFGDHPAEGDAAGDGRDRPVRRRAARARVGRGVRGGCGRRRGMR